MAGEQGRLFDDEPLWDSPPVGANSPETSHEAAASIADHTSRLAQQVLALIRFNGGMTCAEVEEWLGMAHQTASARVWELKGKGLIKDSGKRRKTPSGRAAIVWIKADDPRDKVRGIDGH